MIYRKVFFLGTKVLSPKLIYFVLKVTAVKDAYFNSFYLGIVTLKSVKSPE